MMDVENFLARIVAATDLKTQAALAEKLGVRPASITEAKKRNIIPANWLLELARAYGLNPIWLADGVGPKYIESITVYPKSEVEKQISQKMEIDNSLFEDIVHPNELSSEEFWKLLVIELKEIAMDSMWSGWYQVEFFKRFPELINRILNKKSSRELSKNDEE
jgi:hypothetical protein